MKAIMWTAYGGPDVLKLVQKEKPTPKPDEVLIKIAYTTVAMGDCETRALKLPAIYAVPIRAIFGWKKPKNRVLGQELSGTIEAVGETVTQFKKGDNVTASTGFSMGAYAEYICLKEVSSNHAIAKLAKSVPLAQAATLPTGGLEARHFVQHARLNDNKRVLINGAGGGIGTYVLQLAKLTGAHVTAVDSGKKLAVLKKLGADETLDYTKINFRASPDKYDVIIDIAGRGGFLQGLRRLKRRGHYFVANPVLTTLFLKMGIALFTNKKMQFGASVQTNQDLAYLCNLMAEGKLVGSIDKTYLLKDIVKAHIYVDTGKKSGHVVVKVS